MGASMGHTTKVHNKAYAKWIEEQGIEDAMAWAELRLLGESYGICRVSFDTRLGDSAVVRDSYCTDVR